MGGFPLRVTWVVLSAAGTREREAVDSATAFLKDIEQAAVGVKGFQDRVLPWAGAEIKEVSEQLKLGVSPGLVLARAVMTPTRTIGWSPISPETPSVTTLSSSMRFPSTTAVFPTNVVDEDCHRVRPSSEVCGRR